MAHFYAGLIACTLDIICIPLIIVVANKRGWYDQVNSRKIHTGQIARLGGVGIFWSFAITVGLVIAFASATGSDAFGFWPVAVSMAIVHGVGLWDDFRDLRARVKFIAHVLAAIIVVSAGFRFRTLFIPWLGILDLGAISYPLTVIWIVGVINAINMIDGMDGLSGGVSIIAAFAFGLILFERGLSTPAMAAVALVGSLAGYLFYNFPPARIFMGDSGSTFLGFALAVLPLLDTSGNDGFWLLDAITILLIPIYDVFAAMLRRARKGVSLMSPDRWHLHHKLLRLGLGNRAILAVVYATGMGLGAVAISVLFLSATTHFFVVVASWATLLITFIVLHFAKERSLSEIEMNELE